MPPLRWLPLRRRPFRAGPQRGGFESRTTVSSTNVLVPSAFVTSTRRYRSPASTTTLSSPRAECSRHSGPTCSTETTPSCLAWGLRSLASSARRCAVGSGGPPNCFGSWWTSGPCLGTFFAPAVFFAAVARRAEVALVEQAGRLLEPHAERPEPEPRLEAVERPERGQLDPPLAEVVQVPPRCTGLVDERVAGT